MIFSAQGWEEHALGICCSRYFACCGSGTETSSSMGPRTSPRNRPSALLFSTQRVKPLIPRLACSSCRSLMFLASSSLLADSASAIQPLSAHLSSLSAERHTIILPLACNGMLDAAGLLQLAQLVVRGVVQYLHQWGLASSLAISSLAISLGKQALILLCGRNLTRLGTCGDLWRTQARDVSPRLQVYPRCGCRLIIAGV